MLYMIGGPPRMGKSTLAQKLLAEKKIPYVSTDGLTVMLKSSGVPSFYSPEKANSFYPYLEQFISRMITIGPDYAIEGDSFLPVHVARLQQKYKIRCVFLVMEHITARNIKEYAQHDKWISEISDGYLDNLATRVGIGSAETTKQCKELNMPFFDLSGDYERKIKQAYSYLIR